MAPVFTIKSRIGRLRLMRENIIWIGRHLAYKRPREQSLYLSGQSLFVNTVLDVIGLVQIREYSVHYDLLTKTTRYESNGTPLVGTRITS